MSIRVAQKRRRGVEGEMNPTYPGFKNFDVTSGSMNKLDGRLIKYDLSPLLIGPVGDFEIFENYWQYGKVWKHHLKENGRISEDWWKFHLSGESLEKGRRRPLGKQYGRTVTSFYNMRYYEYIESRKEIYVPIYTNLIENTRSMNSLIRLARSGENIMILDGDGPPREIYPNGAAMTDELWNTMIEDEKYSFGHGYVVAKLLMDSL